MTSLATAVGGMKHWDWCPICRGGLDTGLECDQCGADLMPIYKAFKDLQARPTDSSVLRGIKARADRSRLGYGGKAWVTSDPKSEVVEDRMILIEIVGRQEFAINRLRAALNEAADSFKNAGLSVDAEDCEQAINESLSGGNPGEPKACTPAEERGIVGATGAEQPSDGNPESTGDSADRRSPDGTACTPSPDESNRHFDRGCFVIMELMQAYERRVRSDCTTQEQIDKLPWECAEYIKAAEYLRAVWSAGAPVEPEPAYLQEEGHYENCSVYEGSQRGPCSCRHIHEQSSPVEPESTHRAQVHAGEQAVIDNLRKLGLLPDEATFTCVCGHKMREPSGGAFTVCFGCNRQWACIPERR